MLITLPSLGNPSGILGKRVKEGISFLPHRLPCHPALTRPGGEARPTQGKQASTNYWARTVRQPLVCTGRQCVGGCGLKQGLVIVPGRWVTCCRRSEGGSLYNASILATERTWSNSLWPWANYLTSLSFGYSISRRLVASFPARDVRNLRDMNVTAWWQT